MSHTPPPSFSYCARGHRMPVIIMDMQWGEINILSGLSCSPASTFNQNCLSPPAEEN